MKNATIKAMSIEDLVAGLGAVARKALRAHFPPGDEASPEEIIAAFESASQDLEKRPKIARTLTAAAWKIRKAHGLEGKKLEAPKKEGGYEKRVREAEALGMTRSDAQSFVEAEDLIQGKDINPGAHASRALKLGELVRYEGKVWRVGLINQSRARLDCLSRSHKKIIAKGEAVEFDSPASKSVSIAVNSDLERVTEKEASTRPASPVTQEDPLKKITKKNATAKSRTAAHPEKSSKSLKSAPSKTAAKKGEQGYKGHRPGSRKETAHKLFDSSISKEAATKKILALGIKESTVQSWFSSFGRA